MKKLNTNKQSIIQRLLESPPRGGAWMRMFFMLILMMMSSALAMAQDSYGFKIADVEVTSENSADLSVIEGVEGKISYNSETNTLTMLDVTIDNVDNGIFINSSSEGLNIEVLGDNSITTENVCITGWNKPCNISGSGTLRLKSAESAGIYAYNSQAVIEGVKLYTEGLYGIGGNNGESGEELIVRNAYVEATGSNGSICDFQNVVLDGCSITQPEGAAYDAELRGVALNRALVKDKVIIASQNMQMYGIRIAGVEVTSDNCAELSYIDGINCGEMSYDPKTNTLMMKEVSFSPSSTGCAIENYGCANLNINVTGYVGIQTTEAECICLDEATTISGTGTIVTESEENEGIVFRKSLTIDGIRLYGENKCGITGENGDKEVLTVRNAYVKVGTICNIKSLVLDGSSIVQPEGAAFDATLKGVAFEGDLATDVLIKPTDYLGIDVAGVMVTKANCSDLSVLDGVTGKLSYNPMTNTLTMQDCTISPTTSDLGLFTEEGKDLKVEILGNNNITARDGCIMLYGKSTIGGSGTLNVTCTNNTAIFARTPSLTIEGIRLIVEGDWSGITGFDGQTEVITVRNAYVEVTGGLGSIDDIKDLVLEGCSIVQPRGAAFDAALKGVALNGELVKEKVVIAPYEYGIWINDHEVTILNYSDLSGIPDIDGKMSYNPTTNTLTMENVTINVSSNNSVIYNYNCNDLKVELLGNNSITAKDACFVSQATTTIGGSGTLTLKSDNHAALQILSSNLTVEDIAIKAEGKWGIMGFNKDESLTLRNAYVEVTGRGGSVLNLNSLNLDGCSIIQPVGAAFDAELHAVTLNGAVVKDKVVIGSDASGINDITADVPARKKGVFTVQGVKLTQQWNELPAGIYIVDGVKRVKK
uniref:hypothetical protein n=1 Tax=Prevotella sp. TaxID=59823 RepID=UPI0040289426